MPPPPPQPQLQLITNPFALPLITIITFFYFKSNGRFHHVHLLNIALMDYAVSPSPPRRHYTVDFSFAASKQRLIANRTVNNTEMGTDLKKLQQRSHQAAIKLNCFSINQWGIICNIGGSII